mgnify:CR=1 FL=1
MNETSNATQEAVMHKIKGAATSRDKRAMEVFVDDLQQQTEGVREAVRKLSCMRERVYGPRPPTISEEENAKSPTQPGLASRADRGVCELRDAVQTLHAEINGLEQYI